jgi:teichuronic acid biosynthesis glycosyltransferase TuaC
MRVAVVAEFYPRRHDPVLGVWAHRQAVAARDAGAEVTVFVLHRVVPPAAQFGLREWRKLMAQPRRVILDGLPVHYVRYVSPPRARAYASWGAWAALVLRRALLSVSRREGTFDLVHAHNAVPAGDAVLRAHLGAPLIVSVHGGDLLWTVDRVRGGAAAVSRTLARAEVVLANSAGIATRARRYGARRVEVVHLGSDLPAEDELPPRSPRPLLVTVGHLVARKRHADVVRALARLRDEVRYLIIGDGPERAALGELAASLGVDGRVELAGQLPHELALRRARGAWLFVMPSTAEAFGVAYVEAMAAGIPALGASGEPGPEEIAAAGGGIELVPAGDPAALAARIERLLAEPGSLGALGAGARANVEAHFSWPRCGEQTCAIYAEVTAGVRAGTGSSRQA